MGTPCALLRLKYFPFSVRKAFLQSAAARFSRTETFGCSVCTEHALFRRQIASLSSNSSKFSKLSSKSLQTSLKHRRCRTEDATSVLNPRRLSNDVFESSDAETEEIVWRDFELREDFVSEEEEKCLLEEVEEYLEDLEYEYDHWDNAIHGYRETEKSRWTEKSQAILQRVRQTAFPAGEQQLSLVHVLDLAKDGYIKPHVDSVKFCGSTITGLSLLSPAVMRLAKQDAAERWVNVVLKPRSLYVMKDKARYQFTHEILKDSESMFRGQRLPRDRRISVMCRNEPSRSAL